MAKGRHDGGEWSWVWLSSFHSGAVEPVSETEAWGLRSAP